MATLSIANILLKGIASRTAGACLEGAFSPMDIGEIVEDTGLEYDRESPNLPHEDGLGGRLMLHMAALTVAFHRVLIARGLNADEARRWTAKASWLVYERMSRVPEALSAWRRDPHKRLETALGLLRRFPFSRPSYDMVDVPAPKGTVAFDVLRCPVADYFSTQGLSELCQKSFCDLDFPLAERWSATLERTGTLAGGAPRCDFRWRIARARLRNDSKGGTL
jgi:L-2-amino-thiazoline-4-carboxylic acid hydrolase